MRALSMRLTAERRMLKADGLHRWFLAEEPAGDGGRRIVKQLLPGVAADPSAVEKWLAMAERNAALGQLDCAQVEDWGTYEGAAYVVSRWAAGEALSALVDKIRQSEPRRVADLAAYIGAAILETLDRAQQQDPSLTHLDLDPDWITVCHGGSLMLPEFGLWSALTPAEFARARFDSGRVSYCSPELVQSRPSDRRSDIFSVGVLLYRLLTGELPFSGGTQLVIAMAIADGKRAPIRDKAPHASQNLCQVVEAMLATKLEERFQAPAAARNALLTTMQASLAELATALGSLAGLAAGSAVTQIMHLDRQSGSRPSVEARGQRSELTRPSIASGTGHVLRPSTREPVLALDRSPMAPPLTPRTAAEPRGAMASAELATVRGVEEPLPPPLFLSRADSADSHSAGVRAAPPVAPLGLSFPASNFKHTGPGEIAAHDGRTSTLQVPPTGLSRPLVENTSGAAPSHPPIMESRLPAIAPQGLRFAPQGLRAAMPRAPELPASGPDDWSMPKRAETWRDPSDTVFQMKSRAAGGARASAKRPPVLSTVLLSLVFGFVAVIGLYLAYRLL